MIFLSAQPFDSYFLWQVEVQIVNFRKFAVSDKMHIIVWYPDKSEMTEKDKKTGKLIRKYLVDPDLTGWKKLQEKYPEVKIFLYKDEGVNLGLYIPQLRPHSLKKHFRKFPELEKEVIFYHDSDIIFNYLPDFQSLAKDDINWQSDCSHYLDYKYLRDKEIQGNIPAEEAIKTLADIGNVSVETIKAYTGKTGGAQCILKGIDVSFWEDIEKQVIEIRKAFMWNYPNSINKTYFASEAAGFQSWCADMWALNMALWSRDKVTDVTEKLDFSWATDTLETFQKKPIYHNAGATRMTPHLFYKGSWMDESPIGKVLKVSKNTASEQYVKAIEEVK